MLARRNTHYPRLTRWTCSLLASLFFSSAVHSPGRCDPIPVPIVNGDFSQGTTGWTVSTTGWYDANKPPRYDINRLCLNVGWSISQTLTGFQTTANRLYQVRLVLRPDHIWTAAVYPELDVRIDGNLIGTAGGNNQVYVDRDGENGFDYSMERVWRSPLLNLSAGSHTLTLSNPRTVTADVWTHNPSPSGEPYSHQTEVWDVSAGISQVSVVSTIADGVSPTSGPVLARDGGLYGTAPGTTDGTALASIYRLAPDGTYTILKHGVSSAGSLIQGISPDDYLYGTSQTGGGGGGGFVFRISPSGDYQVLHEFTAGSTTDGYQPAGGLAQTADGTIYGMTTCGGAYNCGFLFSISPTGANYTNRANLNTKTTAYVQIPPRTGPTTTVTLYPLGCSPQVGPTVGRDGKIYMPLFGGGTGPQVGLPALGTIDRYDPASRSLSVLCEPFSNYGPCYPRLALTKATDGNLYSVAGGGDYSASLLYGISPTLNGGSYFTGYWPVGYSFYSNGTSGPNSSVVEEPEGDDGHTFYGTTGGTNDSPGGIYRLTQHGAYVMTPFFDTVGTFPAGNPIFARGGVVGVTQSGGAYGKGAMYLAQYDKLYNTFFIYLLHSFGE